ncbi:MAG: 50S ribosomal protein L29 [Deltaproteobacteria bacterium CG12_big_fil_rev_8_21_14_0_65_43_10]|jgi:large subunit ribosomal protein L29|nr:50S ribosomal protein L29 [Desulfobacterales bacterium]OIP32177.1 MAG: 50S ribosomal protein L29 [Deltaproteobacteria bacterium CG2_30_43_15]PIQ45302.1 MAG: 50S ribosomal protein L29 [Deltaproteobacteria bacterium CG12_big_fil_rev_8_21_14_0_65_43_10]PIU85340.1 MAG: 50S ribosomal protein L29 [Deltaproteobacteria bacterium CG06_land_8_20_14_3_00_44_19]PIX26190.1 MAG: 50S ribosomal protein L29 [Deltaproteobacteria bacterium CG_4_8_14_3_um_filter_43_13]PIZ20342.1 MAG: 50S ribosomal protein L29 
MKTSEIRELSDMELTQKEKYLSEELFNLKFQLATGQLENTMRVPQIKKDLARIKTIIREKKL